MEKSNHILKGLGYSFIVTLVVILIYNCFLTFTSMSGNSISLASAFITTISAAIGGFYAAKKIKEKGLVYGIIVGVLYIVCLILVVYLAQDNFKFEANTLYRGLLTSLAGGIGGILGVNFK